MRPNEREVIAQARTRAVRARCGRLCGDAIWDWEVALQAWKTAQEATPQEIADSLRAATEHIDCASCFPGPLLSRAMLLSAQYIQRKERGND